MLWGREELLNQLPPFHGGGEMIETVTMARSTYAKAPHRFEAGTPPIVEAVGLGAAVDYLGHIGMDAVHAHEQAITAYALEGLATVPGLTVLGPLDAASRGGAISFELDGVHPHDVAQVLDSQGIAVRAGHHCAKPAHARFGVQSSTRMSSYLYTTPDGDRRAGRGPGIHPLVLQVGLSEMDLDTLYQEIILDHYKNPHHAGLRDPFEAEVHHVNPTCGDEVTLRVHVSDGVDRGRVVRRRRLLDLAGLGVGDGRPGDRQDRRRGDVDPRRVPGPDAGQGHRRAGRGRAGGRHRVRRRRQVPGAREVRTTVVDGLEGRHDPDLWRQPDMADHSDLPDVPEAYGCGGTATVTVDDVTEAMKDVVDPELGINVVDLGLVYDVHLDEGSNCVLDMTLTSAACPLTDVIQDQTNSALEGLVNDVAINWVWMPPWGPDKITPDGREQLRALGFNV